MKIKIPINRSFLFLHLRGLHSRSLLPAWAPDPSGLPAHQLNFNYSVLPPRIHENAIKIKLAELREKALHHANNKEYDLALEVSFKIKNMLTAPGLVSSRSVKGEINFYIARLYLEKGEHQLGMPLLEEYVMEFYKSEDKDEQKNLEFAFEYLHEKLFFLRDFEKMEKINKYRVQYALVLQKTPSPFKARALAEAYLKLGIAQRELGKYADAEGSLRELGALVDRLEQELESLKQPSDKSEKIRAFRPTLNIEYGALFMKSGETPKALKYFLTAKEILAKMGPKHCSQYFVVIKVICEIYYHLKEWDKLGEIINCGRQLLMEHKQELKHFDPLFYFKFYLIWGYYMLYKKDYVSAGKLIEKSAQYNSQLASHELRQENDLEIVNLKLKVYREAEDMPKLQSTFESLLKNHEQFLIRTKHYAANLSVYIDVALKEMSQIDQFIDLCEKALKKVDRQEDPLSCAIILQKLLKMHAVKNENEAVLEKSKEICQVLKGNDQYQLNYSKALLMYSEIALKVKSDKSEATRAALEAREVLVRQKSKNLDEEKQEIADVENQLEKYMKSLE